MAIHREIYILSGIHHQNVVRLLEVIDSPSKCYLVMELCEGVSLQQYINSVQLLSENKVIQIFKQIVSGVAYLHHQGLVHRNLNLENILVNSNL